MKKWNVLAAVMFCGIGSVAAADIDVDLTACTYIARAQVKGGCNYGTKEQNSQCKTDMIAAGEKKKAFECWALANKHVPNVQSSGLAKCEKDAAKLYADTGGNSNTNTEWYKALTKAFDDVSADGSQCKALYKNAIDAWGASKTGAKPAAAAPATGSEDGKNYDACDKRITTATKAGFRDQEGASTRIVGARKMVTDSNASKKATPDQAKKLKDLDDQLVSLSKDNDSLKKELAKFNGGGSEYGKAVKAAQGIPAMLQECLAWEKKLPTSAEHKGKVDKAYGEAETLKAAVFKNK